MTVMEIKPATFTTEFLDIFRIMFVSLDKAEPQNIPAYIAGIAGHFDGNLDMHFFLNGPWMPKTWDRSWVPLVGRGQIEATFVVFYVFFVMAAYADSN